MRAALKHAEGRTVGRTDVRTGMMRVMNVFTIKRMFPKVNYFITGDNFRRFRKIFENLSRVSLFVRVFTWMSLDGFSWKT
jgi:hypothetical protein